MPEQRHQALVTTDHTLHSLRAHIRKLALVRRNCRVYVWTFWDACMPWQVGYLLTRHYLPSGCYH